MRIFLKSIPMLILGVVLFVPNVFAANSVTRLDGASRYEVAVNVSKQGWSSASTVVVANGTAYADVLTAAPLAYKYNAPILLTESSKLTTPTKNRISQLKPRAPRPATRAVLSARYPGRGKATPVFAGGRTQLGE